MVDDQTEAAGSDRIVETADQDRSRRIGYQNPEGNTQVSTADAASHAQQSTLGEQDVDDEEDDTDEDPDTTESDELEEFPRPSASS